MEMDVTTRNFFRLLRAGAFSEEEPIEPLSAWKWKTLYRLSQKHGVTTQIDEGLRQLHAQFFVQQTDALRDSWRNGMPTRTAEQRGRLSSKRLDRRLQDILQREQPSPATELLCLLVDMSDQLLNEGLMACQLVAVGSFLRNRGDKVDFVSLQTWIEQLNMQRMASLIGSLLIELLHFEEDEIPFYRQQDDAKHIMPLVNDTASHHRWYVWRMAHPLRYYRYYPSESVACFIASLTHLLDSIEE
jgi:hypothetical protein